MDKPRYVTESDAEVLSAWNILCRKCGNWFLSHPQHHYVVTVPERKGKYVKCPCGAPKCLGISDSFKGFPINND